MLNNALTLPHLLLIAVVVLVLFGKGKVASLMGEVGRGVTAFKNGIQDDTKTVSQAEPAAISPSLPQVQVAMNDDVHDTTHDKVVSLVEADKTRV
ncbi:MAG TPA: twin-arginine translocase TatA/TatE family subunit [Paenirhodobacter sp.]